MTMFTREREAGVARLGIAATRKMGAAVERNRAKRLVREVFRHHKPAGALDVVVVPRREMLDAPYERIEAEYLALLRAPLRLVSFRFAKRDLAQGRPAMSVPSKSRSADSGLQSHAVAAVRRQLPLHARLRRLHV